ncbi:MAG: hypothetical protein JRH20_22810 [Deltaproteobacteria bacterium]|nr:hypothetical protein [Deltaproteobacteria bacterium]
MCRRSLKRCSRPLAGIAVITLSWGLLSACLGDRCDEGQVRVGATCYTADQGVSPTDGPDGSTLNDGTGTSDGDNALAGQGEACSVDPDCQESVRYCVVMPGQTVGYCTKKDCDVALNDCPDGTQCVEVSLYEPGEPNLCIQM